MENAASAEQKAETHEQRAQDKCAELFPGVTMRACEAASHVLIVRGGSKARTEVSLKY